MEEFTHRVKMFSNLENLENPINPKFCNGREDKKNKRKRQGEEGENSQNPEDQLRKRGRVEVKKKRKLQKFQQENTKKNDNHNMERAVINRLQQTSVTVVKTRKGQKERLIESEYRDGKVVGFCFFGVLGGENWKKNLGQQKLITFET